MKPTTQLGSSVDKTCSFCIYQSDFGLGGLMV